MYCYDRNQRQLFYPSWVNTRWVFTTHSGYHVLYVDDEPDLLEMGKEFLSKQDSVEISTATSAKEGLAILASVPVDAVVCDYLMPGMDGIAFLKEVRGRYPDLPFILFTGRGEEHVVIEAINNGADFYLQKGGDARTLFTELSLRLGRVVRRYKAEQELHRSEERFRSLIQNSSDMIQIIDKRRVIMYSSPSSLPLCGYDPAEMNGNDALDFVHPDDRQAVKNALGRVFDKTNTGIPTEFRIRHKDGHYLEAESVAGNQVDSPAIGGIVTTTRLIAERKKSESALRESENKFSSVFQNSPVPLMIMSAPGGQFIDVNDTFLSLTGYSRDEVIGRTAEGLGILADRLELERFRAALQDRGIVRGMEMKGRKKNGEIGICRFSSSIVMMGQRPYILSSVEDITEGKIIETALKEAKESAEEASLAKSAFLSRMSHELRTPLNAILGFTQILLRSPTINTTEKRQLGIIRSSSEHLLGLINDILDAGKIEEQKIAQRDEPFNLRNTLQQVMNVTGFSADEKGLYLRLETPGTLPEYVNGNERRLRQLLLNLLANAVKYTHKGGVTLRAGYEKNGPGLLKIEVEDTGIGIPKDMLATIFEPFTRIAEPGQHSDGTGLGLAIVRDLLTQMQGSLRVESEPGRGSTFFFEIPLPEVKGSSDVPEAVKPVITGYTGRRRTLLVVDDQLNNIRMLISALEPLGFIITTVDNGGDAVRQVRQHPPDLILLDLLMPGMDGLDVITDLKRESPGSLVKIIGISAVNTPGRRRQDFIAACDDYLAKPVLFDLLLEKIRVQLGIEWETTGEEEPAHPGGETRMEPGMIPPESTCRAIRQIVRRGDYAALEQLVDSLEKIDPAKGIFCSTLRTYIYRYDDEGLIQYLDRLEEQDHGEQN
jgi:PAS domain S-box-containing protein